LFTSVRYWSLLSPSSIGVLFSGAIPEPAGFRLSEDIAESLEGIEFEQVLAFGSGIEGGVLKDPSVFVEEEDGVRPAARAGLMSLLGLLPIIQLECGVSSWRAMTAR
jgi:hypothetical protein